MFPPRNKSYFLRKERQEENRLFAWEMLGTKKMFYPKKYPKMRGFFGHGPGSPDFRGGWDPQF